jgi:hypothetical protein
MDLPQVDGGTKAQTDGDDQKHIINAGKPYSLQLPFSVGGR